MTTSQLSQFLTSAGDRPYRDLIAYHIKRQSARKLQEAVLGEISLLPAHVRSSVEGYIDDINLRYGYDKNFWETTTCRKAFDLIIEAAAERLPLKDTIETVEDALRPENHELAFQLFQIPTLSFAYSASGQRKQRKFMGIRKAIFG